MFQRIIKYCKLMDYDINDILNMSENELLIWYRRVTEKVNNESNFRMQTGLVNDQNYVSNHVYGDKYSYGKLFEYK